MSLSPQQCKSARPHKRVYRLRDGDGLFLQIMPSGARYWVYRFRHAGSESSMVVGTYPEMELDEARDRLRGHRAVVKSGADPVAARKLAKLKTVGDSLETFGSIAGEWQENQRTGWSSAYIRRVDGLLKRKLLPKLGSQPIRNVDVTALLTLLRAIEKDNKLMSARLARTVCSKIFDYAVATGRQFQSCT
jgi:hypothetical protein